MYQDISFFPDAEVHQQLHTFQQHPFAQYLLQYSLPEHSPEEVAAVLDACQSTRDFQAKVIYPAVQRLLQESSDGLSRGGFDRLDPTQSYLFISNHRDIVLDTTLMNFCLLEENRVMTASAIGDNLVQSDFLLAFAKLNRNFLVLRSLSPREMLLSSRKLSQYINYLLQEETRSVWLAQREGRAKDGNDLTHQGVLKMLSLAKPKTQSLKAYFQNLRIVPASISYEWDPTDQLKARELLMKAKHGAYKKEAGEDFQSILRGLQGFKGRIHLQVGEELSTQIDQHIDAELSDNQQLSQMARLLDQQIHQNYKLWPSNFIAYDLLYQPTYTTHYTAEEKSKFEARLTTITAELDLEGSREMLLKMYATPVVNKRDD